MSGLSWPYGDDTLIEYEQENPKRPGTKSYDRYEKYKSSRTHGEATANGVQKVDFSHDFSKGFLKILKDKPPGFSSEASPAKKSKKEEPVPAPLPKADKKPLDVSRKISDASKEVATCNAKKRKADDVLKPASMERRIDETTTKKPEEASAPSWWTLPSTRANRVCPYVPVIVEEPKVKSREGRRFKLKSKLKKDKKDRKDKKHKKDKKDKKDKHDIPGDDRRGAASPGDDRSNLTAASQRGATAITASMKARYKKLEPPTITDSQGFFIRTKSSSTVASQFVGVTPSQVHKGKWKALFIEDSGVPVNIGMFDSEEDAARAYAKAVREPEARKRGDLRPGAADKATATAASSSRHVAADSAAVRAARRTRLLKVQAAAAASKTSTASSPAKEIASVPQPSAKAAAAPSPSGSSKALPPSKALAAAATARLAAKEPVRPKSTAAASASSNKAMEALPTKSAIHELGKSTAAASASSTKTMEALPAKSSINELQLQAQIDGLSEAQLNQVLNYLADDAEAKSDEDYELDFSKLPMAKLIGLHRMVGTLSGAASVATAVSTPGPAAKASSAAPASMAPPQGQVTEGQSSGSRAPASAAKTAGAVPGMQMPAAPLRRPPGAPATEQQRGMTNGSASAAPATNVRQPHGAAPRPNGAPGRGPHAEGDQIQASSVRAGGLPMRSQDWRWQNEAAGKALADSKGEQDIWLGEAGWWFPGFEPPDIPVRDLVMPQIATGNTEPPGACDATCHCNQTTVAMKGDMERPWKTASRLARIQEAMQIFQSHAGVIRRGRVSGQTRFEPAPLGCYEQRQQRQAATAQKVPSLHPQAKPGVSDLVLVESPPPGSL